MATKAATKRKASCSDVQQAAEQLMLAELSQVLKVTLVKASIPIGTTSVSVDGFYYEGTKVVLAEAWAHVGKAKPAQRNKVLADLLKLALISAVLKRGNDDLKVESYLVFADRDAATLVTGKSWASIAAAEFHINPQIVTLPATMLMLIKDAQRKQDIRLPDEGKAETE
jgi:hypothetical protein